MSVRRRVFIYRRDPFEWAIGLSERVPKRTVADTADSSKRASPLGADLAEPETPFNRL